MKKATQGLLFLFTLVFLSWTYPGRAQSNDAFYPKLIGLGFDSCTLGKEVQVLASRTALPFDVALKRLQANEGLPLAGANAMRPQGKFRRGLFEYWLSFKVKNQTELPFTLGIEHHFITGAWVVAEKEIEPLAKPERYKQQTVLLNLATSEVYQQQIPAGATYTFYLRIKDHRLGRDLAPVLWDMDALRIAQQAKLKNTAFGQTIFISLFFTLAIVGTIFFLSRLRAVFGWYMVFKWALACYFLQEIIDYNATQSGQVPFMDWTWTKASLMILVFFSYLQFIHAYVKGRSGSEWIVNILPRCHLFLLGYFCVDILLLLLNQWYLSWVLFYIFLWVVVLFSGRVIWQIKKISYPPTKYLLRGLLALMTGFTLSLLAFTFFENLLSAFRGVELGFLPIGMGGLLESFFFFVSLGEQEKAWLQERLAYQSRETKAIDARRIYEHQLQVVLEQELSAVKRQLDAQEQEILSNQELDLKNQRTLAYKRLQLRTLRYGFLAKTSDDILQQLNHHLANDQVITADEQLTRFGGFVRDLLFLAGEPSNTISAELQLCKRLAQLNDFQIQFPNEVLQPQWRCPALLFLSLVYQSAQSSAKGAINGHIVQEEKEDQVSLQFISAGAFALSQQHQEIWLDAQEQLKNFSLGSEFEGALSEEDSGWTVIIRKKKVMT